MRACLRIRMGLAGLVLAGASVESVTTAQVVPASYYCYYFDQKQTLRLDLERIAFFQVGEDVRLTLAEGLPEIGIAPEQVTGWPIAGWWIAQTPAARRTAAGIEQLVAAIAQDPCIDFVSPVFVGDDGGPLIVTPDTLVGFHSNVAADRAEAILAASKAGEITDIDWAGMKRAYRLRSDSKNGFEVLYAGNALAELPEVKFAESDVIFTGWRSLIPNDPGFPNCWGIHNKGQFGGTPDMDMDGSEAWDITIGDPSIMVVIIDTGVQQNHPDINQIAGTDSTSDGPGNGAPINACDNHGTPVAGCVSAIINNNLGTVGIAPGCKSASARTFISNPACDGSWTSQSSWTVNSLTWAELIGARVTNNSNNYGFTSGAIEQKYDDTRANGMVHFASAGNNSSSTITYPASIPSVNAVAALDEDGNLTSFSNYGNGLAFSAPGIDIYTTDRTGSAGWVGGDYVWAWGTSFASPYTAGVAALVLSADASLDALSVEQIMQQTAADLGPAGYDTTFGWGFVNARQALLVVLCPWDLDGNGDAGILDLLALLAAWGSDPGGPPDFDGDGTVGILDLLTLLANWGPCP